MKMTLSDKRAKNMAQVLRGPHASHCLLAPMLLSVTCIASLGQAVSTTSSEVAADHRPTMELTLPKALELASKHNRHLLLAGLATKEAEEKRNIVRSEYFPHVRNESTALYLTALEGVVIPAGGLAHSPGTGLIPPAPIEIDQGQRDTFTSGTGLIQPLTQLLTVRAGVRAATADVEIAKLTAKDNENSIALLVHKLYFGILIRQLQFDAAQASIQTGAILEEESEQSVTAGSALELAKLQSHAALLYLKQASLTNELAIADLTMQLDDVLGLSLGTRLKLDPDSLGEASALPSAEDAMTALKRHNPKILSAQQDVEKARAGITAARDAYIPNISGLARYSYQSGIPFLEHNFGTFGGSVTYDLYDGGARGAKLKTAKVQFHAAELELAQTEADLSIQMAALYDELRRLEQSVEVAAEALTVKQEAARISEQRMRENAALASENARNLAEAIVAQASLLEARLDLRLVQDQVCQLLGQPPQ